MKPKALYSVKRRPSSAFLLVLALLWVGAATPVWGTPALAATQAATPTSSDGRAEAYYHFALGYHYEELAGMYRKREYLGQAIDEYKQALKYAPDSNEIVVRLAETYRLSGRIREAVEEAQKALKRNPDDLATHRLLGRIYFQTLGGSPVEARSRSTLSLAIGEYEQVVRLAPDDTGALLTLAKLYVLRNDLKAAESTLEKLLAIEPGSQEGISEMARLYSIRGEHQRAIDLLQGTSVGTGSAELLSRLGAAYEQAEDYESAARTYRRALQLRDNDFQIRSRLADALFRTGQFKDALDEYRALLVVDPSNAQVLLRMAQAYRQLKQYPEAEQVLEQAEEAQPGNPEIVFNRALLREVQGDFDGAAGVLRDLLASMTKADGRYNDQEARTRSIVLERLGILYRQNQAFSEAADAFGQLKELGDDYASRGWVQLIETHRQNRDLDAAVAAAEAALEQFPGETRITLQLAGVLGERGDLDRAVELVRAQEEAGADARQVQLGLAQIYERNKRYDEALGLLEEAEASSQEPADLEFVYFLRGAVYERRDDIPKAEAEFRRVLELNPESAIAMNYLGYMLADRELRLGESLELIQKAVEMEPFNGAYLDSLGWVYFRLRKFDLAEKYLKQALARSVKDPTLHDHLGDVYYATGQLALAEREWEEAVAIWNRLPANDLDQEEYSELAGKLRRLKVRLAQKTSNRTPAPPR